LTAFDDGSSGAEGGIGFGGIKLSGGKSVASLMIHMRIIDATNGQVVYSAPIEGSASVSKAGIAIDGVGSLSGFKAAPIGQAIQKMLDKATDDIIVKSFPGTPSIYSSIPSEDASSVSQGSGE
jgi:curli biogenesis system outer membrane secretion channel CsgG